nr:PAS domain-containing sensor histidine kinase [uncultured Caldimonas sp.]
MRADLQDIEQRWGLAVQSAAFGVWDLDVRAEQVHYPPQWKARLGYDPSDAPDSTATWRARVHPDDLQPMVAALHAHLEGRVSGYEHEFRLRAADGSYRWVLSRGRVVERDAQGRATRAIGTLTDMTDRHELERMRRELDHAETVSRAKTEFLSRMSHELRTPLNAVLGFAQLLSLRLGSDDVDAQRRYLAQIEQAGWHLLRLVDNVLELSRAESAPAEATSDKVPLLPVIDAAIDAMTPLARQHGVWISRAEVPTEAAVRADAEALQQVLTNLLSNAIKFNRKEGRATVTASRSPDGWALSVSDTGIGIAPEHMPHLFKGFQRFVSPGRCIDGLGIGLALIRSLVHAMGGKVTVQSTEHVGTTFTVTLPAA